MNIYVFIGSLNIYIISDRRRREKAAGHRPTASGEECPRGDAFRCEPWSENFFNFLYAYVRIRFVSRRKPVAPGSSETQLTCALTHTHTHTRAYTNARTEAAVKAFRKYNNNHKKKTTHTHLGSRDHVNRRRTTCLPPPPPPRPLAVVL